MFNLNHYCFGVVVFMAAGYLLVLIAKKRLDEFSLTLLPNTVLYHRVLLYFVHVLLKCNDVTAAIVQYNIYAVQ